VTGVVVRDGFAAGVSDQESWAAEVELALLGADPPFTDLFVSDVKGERALGGHRVLVLGEGRRDDDVSGRHRLVRGDGLHEFADHVVDVLQLAVLDVERVTAETRSLAGNGRVGPTCTC
jgi:hypothetical protein